MFITRAGFGLPAALVLSGSAFAASVAPPNYPFTLKGGGNVNLVRFHLMPGHRFDSVGVPPLIDGIAFDGMIADNAFDSNAIIVDLDERGAAVVISQHPRRIQGRKIDPDLYKWRHLIEKSFCKLKEFKRITMRACKTDRSFSAMIYLAAAVINLR